MSKTAISVLEPVGQTPIKVAAPPEAPAPGPAKPTVVQNAVILKLPNELLLQIAGCLAPKENILKKYDGYITVGTELDKWEQEKLKRRNLYFRDVKNLISLALTCKHFSPMAQETLYRSVALFQPRTFGGLSTSPFLLFLRTLIARPDLAAFVEHLLVRIHKAKAIPIAATSTCACSDCTQKLHNILDKIKVSPTGRTQWMEDLRAPTEAMSCGLTLASVPNLKTLDLNAKPILAPFDVLELFPSPGDAREVSRLIQGLAATKIRTLTLSTGLNGLRIGPAHALTHLTVDFAGPSPLVFIPKGSFTNVTILMIRCAKGEMHLAGNFRWKLEKLLTCLPTIRTLGFECSTAIENCTIPSAVEKIIIRPAEFGAVNWVRNYLGDFVPRKTALNCVELYWPDDWHAYTFWYMYQELVSRTGVKVVVWWKGYVWRVFEP